MGEYYREIERIRREREAIKTRNSRVVEKMSNSDRELMLKRFDLASIAIQKIFHDIEINEPEIKAAKQKGVFKESEIFPQKKESISLRWGRKLDMTLEEKDFLSKYEYKPFFDMTAPTCPKTILSYDYYCGPSAIVLPNEVRIGNNNFQTTEFLADTIKAARSFEAGLRELTHFKNVLVKGEDYWKKRRNIYSMSPTEEMTVARK